MGCMKVCVKVCESFHITPEQEPYCSGPSHCSCLSPAQCEYTIQFPISLGVNDMSVFYIGLSKEWINCLKVSHRSSSTVRLKAKNK